MNPRRLTLPSSGPVPAGFAVLHGPLKSNVRRRIRFWLVSVWVGSGSSILALERLLRHIHLTFSWKCPLVPQQLMSAPAPSGPAWWDRVNAARLPVTGRPAPRTHFLDLSSRNPHRLDVEFPLFGMRTSPLARASPHFIPRPVTPGVAVRAPSTPPAIPKGLHPKGCSPLSRLASS